MRAEEALASLLDRFERLEANLAEINRRLGRLEGAGTPEPPSAPAAPVPSPEPPKLPETRIERQDPFAPAVHRSSSTRHLKSVNKALSMLGLVPESAEEAESRREAASRHKQTISKALHVLGIARPTADPEEIAREVAVPDLEEGEVIPLPEVADDAPAHAEEEPLPAAAPAPDLGGAVDIDLDRAAFTARDYAAPILHVLVLLAAAGGILYAGGALTAEGPARGAWRELLAAATAVACGVGALSWRSASIHLRALLAGGAALLLHLLVLVLATPLLPLPAPVLAGACAATSLLGAWLVLSTRHPMALLLGFGVALALPFRIAADPSLLLPYVTAINLATAAGAFRLHRLQASVAAAFLTCGLLYGVRAPVALPYAAILCTLYLGQVFSWCFLNRKQAASAAVLSLPALGLTAWTVHVLFPGPGWIKAGVLFTVAAVAAVAAVTLPRRHAPLKGALKAGALLLLLAALPAGLSTAALAPITLFLALLFAVLALALYDEFLRAAGSLMLVVTLGIFVRDGPSTPLLFATAGVATALLAARGKGEEPRALKALLGTVAHGTLLLAFFLVSPPQAVAYVWLALAAALQAVGGRSRLVFLETGAALAAAGAALWTVLTASGDYLPFALVAGGFVPHLFLARTVRVGGLILVLGELLGLTAVAMALPGPLGVLASLFLPLFLLLPWPRAYRATLRGHARFLVLALLARCLVVDVLAWPVADAWWNLRFAAQAACVAAGLLAVCYARVARVPLALLVAAVLGVAVHRETGLFPAALVSALVAGALAAAATRLGRRPAPEPASPEAPPEAEVLPAPVPAPPAHEPFTWDEDEHTAAD